MAWALLDGRVGSLMPSESMSSSRLCVLDMGLGRVVEGRVSSWASMRRSIVERMWIFVAAE